MAETVSFLDNGLFLTNDDIGLRDNDLNLRVRSDLVLVSRVNILLANNNVNIDRVSLLDNVLDDLGDILVGNNGFVYSANNNTGSDSVNFSVISDGGGINDSLGLLVTSNDFDSDIIRIFDDSVNGRDSVLVLDDGLGDGTRDNTSDFSSINDSDFLTNHLSLRDINNSLLKWSCLW
ncbi:hypothetical protein G6F62_014048 [Rhizopus arrhizus]|nr:hypothetical protein G6F62_014048 [Rhizopus arrhizus]